MNIIELLATHAVDRPDARAIVDVHRTITFAELECESRHLAHLLVAEGLRRGDVVLVFCPMSVSLYVTLLALFRLGLVAMFVDPSAGRAYVERCCAIRPPRAFIGTAKAHALRLMSGPLRRIPIALFLDSLVRQSANSRLHPSHAAEPCDSNTPALLTFTSGSTGEPKAALRTHGFLVAQHHALAQALAFTPGSVDLTTLPIFVLANLASGVTSVLPAADVRSPATANVKRILLQIRQHRPTRIVASPTLLSRLAALVVQRRETLDSLKDVFTGGGPVSPRVLDGLAAAAPFARIRGVYGSTEAEPVAIVDHGQLGRSERDATRHGMGLLAGRTVSSIDLRIIPDMWGRPIETMTDTEFTTRCLRANAPGEIVISGDHVLPGYVDGRGDRDTKFIVDGRRWHRTGDAGYVDDAGRVWLLGRCSAAIHDAAGSLYPFSVEAVAQDHPDVARAALFAEGGRRVLAIETGHRRDTRVLAAVGSMLRWAHLDEIRLQKVPVDSRHNAKVDYARLTSRVPLLWRSHPA